MPVQDLTGDAFFVVTVQQNRSKAWVGDLFIPTVCFFASGCATSILAIAVNLELLAGKLRAKKWAARSRRISLGDTHLPPDLVSRHSMPAIAKLKSKFDAHKTDRRRRYCSVVSGIFKDIPLGA